MLLLQVGLRACCSELENILYIIVDTFPGSAVFLGEAKKIPPFSNQNHYIFSLCKSLNLGEA